MRRLLALLAVLVLIPCLALTEEYVPDEATLAVHSAVKELLTKEGIHFEAEDDYAYSACAFELENTACGDCFVYLDAYPDYVMVEAVYEQTFTKEEMDHLAPLMAMLNGDFHLGTLCLFYDTGEAGCKVYVPVDPQGMTALDGLRVIDALYTAAGIQDEMVYYYQELLEKEEKAENVFAMYIADYYP